VGVHAEYTMHQNNDFEKISFLKNKYALVVEAINNNMGDFIFS
jgi:hypothetical protein